MRRLGSALFGIIFFTFILLSSAIAADQFTLRVGANKER